MNITKFCPECKKANAKFHVKSYRKTDKYGPIGEPITFRLCNRCKAERYKGDFERDVHNKPIDTSAYRPDGYTSCACCRMVEACKDSVKVGGPVACEPVIGLISPEYKDRGRWSMDEQVKRLGWDKLPAMGD